MRKITQEAANSFWGAEFGMQKDNTIVMSDIMGGKLFLHGNLIAERDKFDILTISSCGWQTNTTKERLNGILSKVGAKISQVKGVWFVDCKEGNTRLFHNGMTFKL